MQRQAPASTQPQQEVPVRLQEAATTADLHLQAPEAHPHTEEARLQFREGLHPVQAHLHMKEAAHHTTEAVLLTAEAVRLHPQGVPVFLPDPQAGVQEASAAADIAAAAEVQEVAAECHAAVAVEQEDKYEL